MLRWVPLFASLIGCTGATTAPGGLVAMVLYFENRTTDPELNVLGKGIADMLITDLAQVDGLTVVERARMQDLITELKLQQTEYFDPATAGRLGKAVGATHAVTGAITEYDPELRIDLRLVQVDGAQVRMTDQVRGKKDQFFTLEQELATKFVGSLGRALKPPPAPVDGVNDASILLDYARGLDSMDRGDWAAAERILAGVLQQVPTFDRANLRRNEALNRLAEARQRRDALLGEDQQALMANAEARLQGDVTAVSTGKIDEWFGYRDLRGAVYLTAANALLRDVPLAMGKTVPQEQQGAFREALAAYFENTLQTTAEMRAWKAAGHSLPQFLDLPDEDEARAEKLGISRRRIAVAPDELDTELATNLCLGKLPAAFLGSAPTYVRLDEAAAPLLVAEIERSLADMETFEPRFAERQSMRLLKVYGDCLVALGRKGEAVKKWQEGLERFPTSAEFGDLEKRIKANL